ncbi:hypothetical protein [Blastococcus sp. SYSU D00820]
MWSRIGSAVPLLPLPVLAVAALVLGWGGAEVPRADEVARVALGSPDAAPVVDLVAAGDGRVLVVADEAGFGSPASVTVVDGDHVTTRAELAPETQADTAVVAGDAVVVAGFVGPEGATTYQLQVVDPVGGAVTGSRPVAVPDDAHTTATRAAAVPGGPLYVLVPRLDGPLPVLLAVDPATGAVLGSTVVDLGRLPSDGTRYQYPALAVSPDGGTVAVVTEVFSPDAGAADRHRAMAVWYGADLQPLAAPTELAGAATSLPEAVALADDGTLWAALGGTDPATLRHTGVVVTAAPGDDRGRVLTDPGDDAAAATVTDLALAGGQLWVAAERLPGAEASLSTIDPATGSRSAPLTLCGTPMALAVGADGALSAAATCDDAVLVALDPR